MTRSNTTIEFYSSFSRTLDPRLKPNLNIVHTITNNHYRPAIIA